MPALVARQALALGVRDRDQVGIAPERAPRLLFALQVKVVAVRKRLVEKSDEGRKMLEPPDQGAVKPRARGALDGEGAPSQELLELQILAGGMGWVEAAWDPLQPRARERAKRATERR